MNNILPILSLETSGDLCSAAIKLNEKDYYQTSVKQKYIHSEKLLVMIDQVFDLAHVHLKDVKSIAVSIGPGSFTGLRIGLAAAKGLAAGAELPLIPVPTFEALAFKLTKYLEEGKKFFIANKVNSDEFYFAEFIKTASAYKIIQPVDLINKNDPKLNTVKDEIFFGNALEYSAENSISSPEAIDVADWAYIYGEDFLTSDYDYLEPNYLKEFKGKKKK